MDVRARRTSVGRADLSILPFLGSPCGAGCFGLVRASRPSSSRPETRETPVGSAHSCRAAAASCAF